MSRSGYKILSYVDSDKMSDLICDNYTTILILNCFNIDMGFGDLSIGEVCQKNGVDTSTFLAIANLLISVDKKSVNININKLSLKALVDYLKQSHIYFLDYKLPLIRKKLEEALPSNDPISIAVMNYCDEYILEVKKHMIYEEVVVFKYVDDILLGVCNSCFNIDMFSEHHESIESKLSELKNIIIKYYPTPTTNNLSSALFVIFRCESDLRFHSNIEDYLLIPAIKLIENSKTV